MTGAVNMFPLGRILVLILQGIPTAILNPFFWLVIFIAWNQARKSASLEKNLFGVTKTNPLHKAVWATLFGIAGGIIGSLIVILLGISITQAGIAYVWPLAIILALISPHLMCFSYAGGLLALFSLLTGLLDIDVAGLMGLVAALHFVESLLIFFSGHKNPIPVLVRDERYGIIGGFSLQEFWPVPIMLLAILTGNFQAIDMLQMPDWWPLIKPPVNIAENLNVIYFMIPVVAALGYGDIALTKKPKEKCKSSAANLFAFSITLLLLSVLASRLRLFAYAAAVFAPAGHEFLIITGRKNEQASEPLFVPPIHGEMVLDIIKNSPAEKMGLSSGDIILSLNGQDLDEPGKIHEILMEYPPFIWLTARSLDGTLKKLEFNQFPKGISDLGVILVPKGNTGSYVVMEEGGLLRKKLKALFKKRHQEEMT